MFSTSFPLFVYGVKVTQTVSVDWTVAAHKNIRRCHL